MEKKSVIDEVYEKLTAPFPEDSVKFRPGLNRFQKKEVQALPFLPSHCRQDRLDEVLGFTNWEDAYEEVRENDVVVSVICHLTITIDGKSITRNNIAPMELIVEGDKPADDEKKRRTAVKSSYSNAFKRACDSLGVGRYLKDLPPIWVKAKEVGRSVYFDETPKLPTSALPAINDTSLNNEVIVDGTNAQNETPINTNVSNNTYHEVKTQIENATLVGLEEGEQWINQYKSKFTEFQLKVLTKLIRDRRETLTNAGAKVSA